MDGSLRTVGGARGGCPLGPSTGLRNRGLGSLLRCPDTGPCQPTSQPRTAVGAQARHQALLDIARSKRRAPADQTRSHQGTYTGDERQAGPNQGGQER